MQAVLNFRIPCFHIYDDVDGSGLGTYLFSQDIEERF